MRKRLRIILLVAILAFGGAVIAYRETRLRSIPPAAWECLRHPQEMTLYSLDPDFAAPDASDDTFHEHRILGRVLITSGTDRATVESTVRRSVAAWLGRRVQCFEPRHGIRVSDGTTTYDFLACFQCQSMVLFSGEQTVAKAGIRGSSAALDSILRANVPP